MERAFLTTHPHSEKMFEQVLRAYKDDNSVNGNKVMTKLNDVRKRGRKRSMVG
jgi:TP53 regulating kinase-like protein